MADPLPDDVRLLLKAKALVIRELVPSLESALLSTADATAAARSEAVMVGLHRVLRLWHLQPPIAYIAGLDLSPELLQLLGREEAGERIEPREAYECELMLTYQRRKLELNLIDRVRGALVTYDDLGVIEQADGVAEVIVQAMQLPSLRATLGYMVGVRQASVLVLELAGLEGGR